MAADNNAAPAWINEKYVEDAMKCYYKDDELSISKFDISSATSLGDNYSSIMNRASFEITTKNETFSKRVIIKTMPTNIASVNYVTNTDSFETEILMLSKVIPYIEKVLQEVDYIEPLAPKLIFSALEPEKIIIMEDLCESKFFVADRLEGLNLEQCLKSVRALANFHVASAQVLQKEPKLKELFKPGFWGSQNMPYNISLLRDGFDVLKENIEDWSGQQWLDKLQCLGQLPEKMYDVYDDRSRDKVTVINHGDNWTNNMMFRRRGCGLQDIRFVDFQLSCCRSPVYDLLYFIFTSPRKEIRIQQMDAIIKAYHDQWMLMEQLLHLQPSYSFDDLQKDIKDKAIFGFCILYGVLAVVSAPKEDAVDTSEEITSMKDCSLFRNKHYQQCVVDSLPYFKELGLF